MRLREHEGIIPGRIDILYCKPEAILCEDGYNVRDLTTPEARAELDELKAQIKENGVLTPLKVRFNGEQIILVEGHRRRTAALELIDEHIKSGGTDGRFIESVPIFPEPPGTDPIDRDFSLETSNSGTRLKPLELASLIHRINTLHGVPLEGIAKRMGKTLASIKQTLSLRQLSEPVKEHIRQGDIAATTARNLAKNSELTPEQQDALIKANLEENKRLGVGKKNPRTKVTAKTIKRDKVKGETKQGPIERPEPTKLSDEAAAQIPEGYTAPLDERSTVEMMHDRDAHQAAADLPSGLPATQNQSQHDDTLAALITLTREADKNVQHNKSDDHPGWWSPALVDAIEDAVLIIERLTGKPFERETIPDGMSQEVVTEDAA